MQKTKNFKSLLSAALLMLVAPLFSVSANVYAASATLDKIKSSGTVTMGVRESSIPMSYTTGDSRFDGYPKMLALPILCTLKRFALL